MYLYFEMFHFYSLNLVANMQELEGICDVTNIVKIFLYN